MKLTGNILRGMIVCLVVLAIGSCTDKFDEYNTDKTQPDSKLTDKELPGLLSTGQLQMTNWYHTNGNRMRQILISHNAGYETYLANMASERNVQNFSYQNTGWSGQWTAYNMFLRILPVTKPESAERAIAVVNKIFTMQLITDVWGPIPFNDAGDVLAKEPRYESQRTVYYKMLKEIAIASGYLKKALDNNQTTTAYGTGDMIYDGNVEKWYRFCNTLWLRMAMRISNVEPQKAKTEGEKALATGMFCETPAHSAWINHWETCLQDNGICRYTGQWGSVMSTSTESYLKGYKDPRLNVFFRTVKAGADPDDGIICVTTAMKPETQAKVGGIYGLPSGIPQIFAIDEIYKSHSRYGELFSAKRARIQHEGVAMAAEAWFLRAEAAVKGWAGAGVAKTNYDNGIACSLKDWIPTITQTAIDAYINGTTTPITPEKIDYSYLGGNFKSYNWSTDPPVATLPVKFSSNTADQLEQIHIQKWISTWHNASESWAERRRTRLPKIYKKKSSDNTYIDLASNMIQTRCQFVSNEKTTNRTQVVEAIKLLGVGASQIEQDLENIPLWWDINSNGSIAPGNFSSEPADPLAGWDPVALWER